MDPNETLRMLRRWAAGMADPAWTSEEDAQNAFTDLDEWLSKGGFLPAEWANWSTSQWGSGEGR